MEKKKKEVEERKAKKAAGAGDSAAGAATGAAAASKAPAVAAPFTPGCVLHFDGATDRVSREDIKVSLESPSICDRVSLSMRDHFLVSVDFRVRLRPCEIRSHPA